MGWKNTKRPPVVEDFEKVKAYRCPDCGARVSFSHIVQLPAPTDYFLCPKCNYDYHTPQEPTDREREIIAVLQQAMEKKKKRKAEDDDVVDVDGLRQQAFVVPM